MHAIDATPPTSDSHEASVCDFIDGHPPEFVALALGLAGMAAGAVFPPLAPDAAVYMQ